MEWSYRGEAVPGALSRHRSWIRIPLGPPQENRLIETAGLQNRAFRVQVPVLLPKVRWRNSARPECLSYKEEAGGSNPSASTKCGRSVKGSAREVVASQYGFESHRSPHLRSGPRSSSGQDAGLSIRGREFESRSGYQTRMGWRCLLGVQDVALSRLRLGFNPDIATRFELGWRSSVGRTPPW